MWILKNKPPVVRPTDGFIVGDYMKKKISYFFTWIFYNFLNYLPCFIILFLFLIQFYCIFAILSWSSWFYIAAQILILPPWIIVLIIYSAKKNKFHKIGFNEPQVEIILQTIDATETTAKDVIKDYKSFINYETRENSVVAKYFYNNDTYTKSKYEFLTSQCSLSSFCIKKELIAQCHRFRFSGINNEQLLHFAVLLYGQRFYEWIYKCACSDYDSYYKNFEDLICEYIVYAVLCRKKLSYESFLSFSLDLCDFKKHKKMIQLLLDVIKRDKNISNELKQKEPNGYIYESNIQEISYYS